MKLQSRLQSYLLKIKKFVIDRHLAHFVAAYSYSIQGLISGIKSEIAMRQLFFLAILLVPWILYDNVLYLHRSILFFSLLVAIIAEVLNTAIEATVDLISPNKHHLAKKAKDLGSAAVMLALINLVVQIFIAMQ